MDPSPAPSLLDPSRFHPVQGRDLRWYFDESRFLLFPDPGDEAELLAQADGEEERPTPPYRTRTRVSNLKLTLSNRCPSECSYCFRDRSGTTPAPLGLGVTALEAMMEDHGRDSSAFVVSYNLSSEPLADLPALEELVEARPRLEDRFGKPIYFYVCTSATVQSPEALSLLERALRGNRLAVSLDGPREVHDRHRKDASGRGTYERVLSLVRWAEDRGIPLEAQAVLTRDFPHPDLVLESLLELGFQSISMKPVRPGAPGAFRPADVLPLLASYDRYFSRVDRALVQGDWSFFHTIKHDAPFKALWRYSLGTKVESRCFWGVNFLVMDRLGRYYPCDGVVGRPGFEVGTLKAGVDWDRFHADLGWPRRGPCPTCWARSLCGGTCPMAGLTLSGSPLGIDPVECALSQAFAHRCLRLAVSLLEQGTDPSALGPVLTDYWGQQTMTP